MTNQITALLDAHWPGAKAVFADVASPIALAPCVTGTKVAGMFTGLDLVDPGLVYVTEWHPDNGGRCRGGCRNWPGWPANLPGRDRPETPPARPERPRLFRA